jgi:hypothetical protein
MEAIMNRFILWGALLLVGLVGLTVDAEEVVETCDLNRPHASAQYCLTHELTNQETEECCTATCLSCHPAPQNDPDLSGPTEWNSRDAVLADVYILLANTGDKGLADLCIDCHETRFIEKINHPVEIVYEPGKDTKGLIANPEGPKLVCVTSGSGGAEGCLIRCVTCHKLHPVESEGNQLQGLLHVSSAESALCLRCHVK